MITAITATILIANANASQLQCPANTIARFSCQNTKPALNAGPRSIRAQDVYREILVCNTRTDAIVAVRDHQNRTGHLNFLSNSDSKFTILSQVENDMLVSMIEINRKTMMAVATIGGRNNSTVLSCKGIK